MSSVIVVGTQWGDEGKGKVCRPLCGRRDAFVRFQGAQRGAHDRGRASRPFLHLISSGISTITRCACWATALSSTRRCSSRRSGPGEGKRLSPNTKLILSDRAHLIMAPPPRGCGARGGKGGQDRDHQRGIFRRTRTSFRRRGSRLRPAGRDHLREKPRRKSRKRILPDEALRRAARRRKAHPRRVHGLRRRPAAARGGHLAAARRGDPAEKEDPLRRGPGLPPRRGLRHLPLRHLLEHGGGQRLLRRRGGAHPDQLGRGHRQSLHDPGGQRPLRHGACRRDRRADPAGGPGVRRHDGTQAALRLARHWCS